MGRGDLPDMYALTFGPQARGRVHTYQGKSQLHKLYIRMLYVTLSSIAIVTILVG